MGEKAGEKARRDDSVLRGAAIGQRLAEIEQRLAELRQARLVQPGQGTAVELLWAAQQHAAEADRHWREAISHTMLVRQLVAQAFHNAARAHEHAADASERSARRGIGDVAEYRRRAEFHRAAAEADRLRAREIEAQHAEPEPSG